MTSIRPLAVGAAALTLAALDILRSSMSEPTYADTHISQLTTNVVVSSSERLFEYVRTVPTDEVSPDLIAEVGQHSTEVLLHHGGSKGLALDWSTFRMHLFTPEPRDSDALLMPRTQIIIRVDVLQ